MKKLAGIVIAAAVVVVSFTTPAQASSILYATGVGTGPGAALSALYTIDPTTGVATELFGMPGIHVYGGGLTYDAASDSLFDTGADILSQESLYRIDRFAGTVTFVGFTGSAVLSQGGMSIDPLTGVMYATGFNGFQSTGFFSVDKNTGVATLIGQSGGQYPAPLVGVYGLGFRNDGVLFANGLYDYANHSQSQLMTMDLATGSATDIGPHGVIVGRQLAYSGLAFDAGGTMYSLGSTTASAAGLYSVNQATGTATLIGDTGVQFGVDGGLAFAPDQPVSPVPEPGTLGLLAAGFSALLARSRRHRGILSSQASWRRRIS
jgi:hypothetical protein